MRRSGRARKMRSTGAASRSVRWGFAMTKRSWLVSAFVVIAAIMAVGLVAPARAQNPVKIGVLTPLSPPGDASAGQFIVRGAKMAADDVNARGGVLGGRKIEVHI